MIKTIAIKFKLIYCKRIRNLQNEKVPQLYAANKFLIFKFMRPYALLYQIELCLDSILKLLPRLAMQVREHKFSLLNVLEALLLLLQTPEVCIQVDWSRRGAWSHDDDERGSVIATTYLYNDMYICCCAHSVKGTTTKRWWAMRRNDWRTLHLR